MDCYSVEIQVWIFILKNSLETWSQIGGIFNIIGLGLWANKGPNHSPPFFSHTHMIKWQRINATCKWTWPNVIRGGIQRTSIKLVERENMSYMKILLKSIPLFHFMQSNQYYFEGLGQLCLNDFAYNWMNPKTPFHSFTCRSRKDEEKKSWTRNLSESKMDKIINILIA